MTSLATLIDQLPPPQFPESLSDQDRQMVLLSLASAKQQIRPYIGKFEAPWLLTPFSATVWETTNRGREELVNGAWRNTIRIDWRVLLPNSALLTDARYEVLLTLTKKIAFLSRIGQISGTSVPIGWRNAIYRLINVMRWVVLHEERFLPQQHGLRLLDQPSLDWLFGLISEGGWGHVLQIPQRLLSTIYAGAHGITCPQTLLDNPYALPYSEIPALVQWLEYQKCYKHVMSGPYFGRRHLNRDLLAKLISDPGASLNSLNVSRFLRQFESDFNNDSLLVGLRQITEFPHQKTESIQKGNGEVGSEESVLAVEQIVAMVLDAHRHIPDLLPEPANISLRRATSIARLACRPFTHTLFMPINTGLTYLNTAMRFVHVYGDAIVDFYLAVMAKSYPNTRNSCLNKSLKHYINNWRIGAGEPIAAILNITECRRFEAKSDFNRLRSNPTLDEALRVLIGSCIVCLAILKPSRAEELIHLKRDCLREYAGGYWINFKLGKSNAGEAWQEEDRPIPVIAAKAIHLLQKLGSGLSTLIAEEKKIGGNLFYLPRFRGLGALDASSGLLNKHLNIFCDYVGLPPDREGRRWYVRIHEMRKWFLLLLFWSGRFDVLDAARWIAGHTDAEHIYAYIEKEFPGEELTQLEAEYSIDRVYRFDRERKQSKGDAYKEDGVDVLYKAVLKHFNVEALTMVPDSEWTEYVRSLRNNDAFRLEPHSIFDENGRDVVGINISFVMREVRASARKT